MINKSTKNALYAEILAQSSELLKATQKEFAESADEAVSKEEETSKKASQKSIIQSYQRIHNNAIMMLLKNGFKFYTGTDDWKKEKTIFFDMNGKTYTIDMQAARTLLSSEADTIFEDAFSQVAVNNKIDLSLGMNFDFHEYAGKNGSKESYPVADSRPVVEPVTKEDKSNKLEETEQKPSANKVAIKKEEENKKQNQKGPKKADNPKFEQKPQKEKLEQAKKNFANENKNQQPKKKKHVEPVVPVSIASDLEEFFMNEDEIMPEVIKKPAKDTKTQPKRQAETPKSTTQKNSDVQDNLKFQKTEPPQAKRPDPEETIKISSEESSKPLKTNEDESMELIDNDGINITEITTPSVSVDPVNILVEELIMDIYTVKMKNGEESGDANEKVFTIIIAPASSGEPENSVFIPTFSYAKSGRNVCTCATADKIRPSYQILLDNESFFVRGGWNQDGFFSLLYPQNTGSEKVTIQKRQIKPQFEKNIGHNIVELDNKIKIHVLPLSSKNSSNGKVGVLVCLEDPAQKQYISASTKEKTYVDIPYLGRVYRITAFWEGKRLLSDVQIL